MEILMAFVWLILFVSFYFLIKWNIYLTRESRKDRTMFKMAKMRRDVISFLLKGKKYQRLNENDLVNAVGLIKLSSFIISNHKGIYNGFRLPRFKRVVKTQMDGVDEAKSNIPDIHNKTIKAFYTNFGSILLHNIKDHISFFGVKVCFAFIGFIVGIFKVKLTEKLKQQDDQYDQVTDWYQETAPIFAGYRQKYC